MRKFPEILSVFIVYLLTVPTNVMCLGTFTEVWLKNFCISRNQLACLYLVSTVAVFIVMTFPRYVYSTRGAFLSLSLISLILTLVPDSSIILFLFFFLLQWLGQGCLVGQCRCRLFSIVQASRYGCAVGLLEAMGTCAVFLCPFFLLFLIHQWTWQTTLCLLALIYGWAAFIFKIPQITNASIARAVYKDVKFWIANFIIYLPVMFVSGLFFHLEGICKVYNIPLKTWEYVSQIQAPGIIVGQVFFGYFWCKSIKRNVFFLAMLVFSQGVWLANLFCFNLVLCIVCGVIGWSLFGVLVNAFWSCLYLKQPSLIAESIEASIGFGFLANAIGPILLCVFL